MTLQQAFLKISMTLPTDEPTKRRLARAYDIVRMPGYEITEHISDTNEQYWHVAKLATTLLDGDDTVYVVTLRDCTCPDYNSARAGLCKHRLAVKITEAMKE